MYIKKVLICFVVIFYCACNHNDCCSSCSRISERNSRLNSMNIEEKKEYLECRKRFIGDALVKCRPGYFSKEITQGCVDDFIYHACVIKY